MGTTTVALCQFRPTKGPVAANLDLIARVFSDAAALETVPDVLVFAEGSLTGYFLEGGVREHAVTASTVFEELNQRHAASGAPPFDVVLGFYEIHQDQLHNSAIWMSLGGSDAAIRHVHRKVFLPTYGVFDEERFVEAGHDVRAFDTRLGRVAVLVCEDAWHSITGTIAAVDGAQLIAVVSASPARGIAPDAQHPGQPTSLIRWEAVAQQMAAEHGVFVALTQLVGFEAGKGFPGGSLLIAPDGAVLARAPLFEDALVATTVDLSELVRVRAAAPLLADLEVKLPHMMESLERARVGDAAARNDAAAPSIIPARNADKRTAVSAPVMAIDAELTRKWLVEFLRDEVRRRRGFERVVIGMSGGIDSALVAFLAVEALGRENVVALRMPFRDSSPESLLHAREVCSALEISERTIDITAAVDGYVAASTSNVSPQRLGNVMARVRMTALFDIGAEHDALPLGTGNKSERLLGYFTWHGDDAPPVNAIGDLYKTQVRQLALHLGVPRSIVDKPASADLIQGQTDEGDIGISYERADPLLELLLRGHDADTIAGAGFTAEEVALVRKRVDGTHWKRRLPSVAMVSQTAIGEYYLRPLDF